MEQTKQLKISYGPLSYVYIRHVLNFFYVLLFFINDSPAQTPCF